MTNTDRLIAVLTHALEGMRESIDCDDDLRYVSVEVISHGDARICAAKLDVRVKRDNRVQLPATMRETLDSGRRARVG